MTADSDGRSHPNYSTALIDDATAMRQHSEGLRRRAAKLREIAFENRLRAEDAMARSARVRSAGSGKRLLPAAELTDAVITQQFEPQR